jgi:hypothetical protein
MLEVYQTEEFEKHALRVLSPEQYRSLPQLYASLTARAVRGKCLAAPWLWELKLRDKLLYFVIVQTTALFIRISDKNEQQRAIDAILRQKEAWIVVVNQIRQRA